MTQHIQKTLDSDNIHIQVISANKLNEPLSSEAFFFQDPSFICRNEGIIPQACVVFRGKEQIAQCAYHIIDQEAISLPLSPFGSFDLDSSITKNELSYGIRMLSEHLRSNNAKKFYVRLYPQCYNPDLYALQISCFLEAGFTELYTDKSQFFNIRKSVSFRSLIHDSQYRHLNFGLKKENDFRKLTSDALNEVYSLLKKNRDVKGYPMTMRLDQLEKAFHDFPDRYLLFGFFIGEKLAAAAVCIHVNSNILYDFYHGHDEDYSHHSPIITLVNGIYLFAQKKGYKTLDLGISTEKGKRNQGLFRFKNRIGAESSPKAQLVLNLTSTTDRT